ncbi:molybdenum cofactor biosynthesis protein MoaE [Haloglycomyces albus]|uniref:molybdenum cofactor biosynthesis protein MoaE n=1 Tax=Haloglycomyces albus TaxID=526067 RepID=UPI00046D4AC0|nr:molybdenum cofactor biosynthesis protein MoaE [Haloglycomyces albus]
MILTEVTDDPINVDVLEEKCRTASSGAHVTFRGVVRDHDHGRQVTALSYEGHPSAASVLDEIAHDMRQRFQLDAIAISHRLGDLSLGDAALVVVIASAHRAEAFQALTATVDEVKDRVPVWKHQYFSDGSDEWVNCA